MARVRPLEALFGRLTGTMRRSAQPTETVGVPAAAAYGGYVLEEEKDSSLTGQERYRTFSQILVNTSIVAAGVRYYLSLASKSSWSFAPSDADEDGRFAELAEEALTKDPATTWKRVVRRAAMYRMYGFSVQEWTARRREDGVMTFADIAPRAQVTIERWDLNTDGSINGMIQRNPQNQQEIYLPRAKVLYLVDDTLNDSPTGLGVFRHLIKPAKKLERYEQLEGFGFETDLRGVPVGKAPYSELRRLLADGVIKPEDVTKATKPVEDFVAKHIKNPQLGLLLDSDVYSTTDDAQRPSGAAKFDLKLLQGGTTALPDIYRSIERVNRELARCLGVEQILLGESDRGSFALSNDKTNQFSLSVDAALEEIAEAMAIDLLDVLWELNGWPDEMKPTMKPDAVRFRDVEQVARALRDMAAAGAVLPPDDPAINDVRGLLGISLQDPELIEELKADAAQFGTPEDRGDDAGDSEGEGTNEQINRTR